MNKKRDSYMKFILLSALLATAMLACKKDKETDTHPPAWYIAESEQLVIPAAIELPDNLPKGNTRVATYYAEGVQKYKAQQKAGSDPATYEWVFVAPEAVLYDITNARVGTHSAGPSWQLTGVTDSIYGQAFTPAKTAASPDPAGIDWLLLMPKTGKVATGIFANVAYIQRIATTGGKAPAQLPVNAGETTNVAYTAIYRFTKKNP
ncbi:DUF3455 domain-containing protein [Paraflavitalea soli]|uniref:DUF3455 domain-containing protein n=1 Tax=Paraflavitalea soli TaxID=2315862 RepID=A0A3B7MLI5_9BACT|nr:DUF3455 domain-containing protein [Paraflavitalea soli]AXY75364.1 DUF3455 domain-containing protein [Paraflavitalea soli]